MIYLKENERIDDLQRKGYKIIQNPEHFCFGTDAVLLTAFALVKEDEIVLDMCTGTGVIPILLEAKTQGKEFHGMEIQEWCADMAERSVKINSLSHKVHITCGDLKEAAAIYGKDRFNVVTCNPPYMVGSRGLINPEEPKAIARHEIKCTLEDVVRSAAEVLKVRGRFYMVHRPFRIAEIFAKMEKYNLIPKRMRLVYPTVDKEPVMVLIEGMKGAGSGMKVEKPLIICDEKGNRSEEIEKIYNEQ